MNYDTKEKLLDVVEFWLVMVLLVTMLAIIVGLLWLISFLLGSIVAFVVGVVLIIIAVSLIVYNG